MDGQNVINEIAFSQSVINIGSDSGNDIVLRGAKVADFHAMLNYAGSTWHLIPLDPGYPVLLNGRGIGPEGSTLPTGSVLSIGDYRLTVSVNGMNADILVAQTAPLPGDVKEAGTPEETSGKNILLTITAPGTYEVETGNTVEYELTVTNAGPLVANMQIQLQGVPSAWVQIIPPVLNLNEARKGTFQVRISPPRDPSSEAGEYHLHFVAISPNYPGETATADTSLMVLPFRQFLLNGPNPRRLNLKRTHREDYSDVVILNQSNSETTYMVRSFDDGNELNYAYKLENDSLVQGQDTITVPAGESQRVPVQVGARKAPVFGFIDRVHHYYTSVTPADDPTSAQSVVGEVHVRPLINGLWLLLFILLILLLNLFIFQPYIYQFSSISGKLTEVIIAGESVTVDWRTSHFASNVTLTEGTGGNPVTVEQSGSMVLTPKVSTTYRLKAANLLSRLIGLTYEKELNVLLIPARPSIDLFSTDIKEAYFEQPVNLKWAVGENAETAFMVINKQRTDLAKENYSGSQENKFNSDTLLWMRAQNQSGYETKSLFVNVDPDKINLNRFTAWVRPNGIAVPSDNDVRRTTRWGSLANLYGTVPTPQTLRPANVNPMPAPQSNVLEIPDNYGTAPYTGAVSPEQQLLSGSDNGLNPSAAELLVSPSLVSTPAAPAASATEVPMIQAPMRTPVASATAPASSPERAVNREFSIKLAEVIEDPMSENGYRTIWYFDNYVLQKGEQVLIDWEVSGVPNVKIENLSADPVGASGSDFVYPEKNTNYTLEAEIGSLKKNFTLPLLVAGDADNGEGSGLNCELKANATTLTVPGSVMLTWSGGGSNRVQLISSAKAESENADAEKKKEAEAKEKGEPYTKPTNAPLEGGIIGDWLQPAGFMRVNVDKQTTFVLNAYDGNGNVICTKSAEVKYTGGNDKLDLKMKISKIADMDDNETKTFYVGQTAQFTVAFSDFEKGKDPTGSVMITDGDSTCSVTLPKDTCSMVLKHEGTRKITAVYSGDNTYNKLTATGSVTVISKRSLQLDITKVSDDFPDLGGVSQPYYVVGQDIFYTVNLSKHLKGRIPTGTIKISDGTGTCTVTWPDQKTCSIKAAKAGENIRVTAEYSGDEVYKPATAETTVEVLTKRPITFKITKVTDMDGNELEYYRLGQKYRVYTELTDYPLDLVPTGTIMITDGLSTCTVTLPDNACDLEAKKQGDLTVKAVYSGDANYVTKVAETTINVKEKIKTTLSFVDAYKTDASHANFKVELSWDSKQSKGEIPTGYIKFTVGTGTCDLDMVKGSSPKLSCDGNVGTPELDDTSNPGKMTLKFTDVLLNDTTAKTIKGEYQGDALFGPSSKTVDFLKLNTSTEILEATKPSDNFADLLTKLTLDTDSKWTSDDPKRPPTGTIIFYNWYSADSTVNKCTLDIVTMKMDCNGEVSYVDDMYEIKNLLLGSASSDRVRAEYSGDSLYNSSTSATILFNMIVTETTITELSKPDDDHVNFKVDLTWLDNPKDEKTKPTGTITFTTGSQTCTLDIETAKLKDCDGTVTKYGDKNDFLFSIVEMSLSDSSAESIIASYSGDSAFLESESQEIMLERLDTEIKIKSAAKTSNVLADIAASLTWDENEADDKTPTGTITIISSNNLSDLTTCIYDLDEGKYDCEGSFAGAFKDGEYSFDVNNLPIGDFSADRVRILYSGDEYFKASTSTMDLLEKHEKVDTEIKISNAAKDAGNKIEIEAELSWDVNPFDSKEPTGKIIFTSGGATCTLDIKTKEFEKCSGDFTEEHEDPDNPSSPVIPNPDYDPKTKTLTIKISNMVMSGTPGDSIYAEYSGDTIYNKSTSPAFNFDGKINTELDIAATRDTDNKLNVTAVLHLEALPPDKQNPTGIITFTSDSSCSVNLATGKFEKCSGSGDPDDPTKPKIEFDPENKLVRITATDMSISTGSEIYAEYSGDTLYNKSVSPSAKFEKRDPGLKILRILDEEGNERKAFIAGTNVRVEIGFENATPGLEPTGSVKVNIDTVTDTIDLPQKTKILTLSSTPGLNWEAVAVYPNGDTYYNNDSNTLKPVKTITKHTPVLTLDYTNEDGHEENYVGDTIKITASVTVNDPNPEMAAFLRGLFADSPEDIVVNMGSQTCTIENYPENDSCTITTNKEVSGNITAKYPENYYFKEADGTKAITVVRQQPELTIRHTNSEGVEQESYYVGETIRVYADLAADVTDEQKVGEIKITLGSATCSINYPGEEYCTLETAGDGVLEIKGVFDGNDYLKPDDDTAEIIIGKNAIKLEIEKVVNAENEIEQVDDYYVTGQKIRVWIRLYDAEGGYDQTGTINVKAAESEAINCTIYPAPVKQYCDIELGSSYTGDVNLTAEYSGNIYYPARTSASKTIVVKEPIEPILSFRYAYLAIDDENNVKLKLELSENYFNEYSISPLIDETYDPPRPGTIRFTMTDPSGSSSDPKVCELDLTTGDGDAEAALGDDCIINGATATYHKESVEIYGVKSYLFTITGMLNPFGSGAKIKAEYLGSDYDSGGSYKFNRYFLSASDEYTLNPGDKGVTEIDVTKAVQLGGAYAFIDASLTYDEATLEEYSVRAAEDSGKLTLTTVGGASETVCTWDFGTDTSPDCPELRVDKTYDDANLKVNFEIIGARITNDTTSVKLAYSDDDFYLPSQTTTPLTAEALPTIEIDHAVRPNYSSGTVVFKVSGIGPVAQKYSVYNQVEGKVSADGTAWKTPVCVFGLPGSSGQCGGTVSETGEGGYKLDNWTVSSPADYFGNTAEYVKMTLQSSVYTNLNTDGAPSSQKQFGLETKLTMFDVLYAHGYDFLETNLTYDKETLSSYVPTGKIKVTFLNADGNPYPTQTSDYEFTVSAPISAGLIDDIATNIRMQWGAHYTAYAEYLGDGYFRYCKSETVTITQEDDPTLSITNAMKKKDSSDGMNYLYALFKISNLGTLWDKYGIIDGYVLQNYPITSRTIKYPAVDQRPGAMVIQPAGYQNDGTVTETETGTFLVKGLKLGIGAGLGSGTGLQVSLTTPYSTLIVSGIIASKEYSTIIKTKSTMTGSHKFLVQDSHIFLTSYLNILDNEAKELYGIDPSGTVTYTAGTSTCTFTFPDEPIEETYKERYGNCTVSVEPAYTSIGKKFFTIKVLDWHGVSSSPGWVTMTYSGDGIHKNSGITVNLVPSTPRVTINSAIKTSPTTASVMFTIDDYFDVNTYKEFLVYDRIQIGLSGSGGSMSKLVKIPEDGDFEIIGLEETINGKLLRNGNVFEIQDLEIKTDYEGYFSTFHAGLASYETYNGTGLVIDVEKNFTMSGFGTSLGSPASIGSGSPVSLSLELEP